jgi:hypothetical protein
MGPSEADLLEEVLLCGTGLDKVPPSAEVIAELNLLVAARESLYDLGTG